MQQRILESTLAQIFLSLLLLASLEAEVVLRVGVNVPLSGVAAEYGVAVRNGIDLAREEDPEGFRSVQFIFEDNAYDGKRALSVHHKFRNLDKVHVEFAWGEVPVGSVSPVAEQEKFPIVALATDPRSLKTFKYTIRFLNSQAEYAEKLVQHLRKLGINKIGVIMADDPYYNSYVHFIGASLRDSEKMEIIANHLGSDNDFRSTIMKARRGTYDAIGVLLFLGQISSFYRQAKQLEFRPVTFGADDFESKSEIAAAQGGMNGAFFVINQIEEWFLTRYRNRFKIDGHLTYAANAYEFARMMQLLQKQIEPADDGTKIIARLTQLRLPNGAMGATEFRNTAEGGMYFRFPIAVKKIVDGQIVVVP